MDIATTAVVTSTVVALATIAAQVWTAPGTRRHDRHIKLEVNPNRTTGSTTCSATW